VGIHMYVRDKQLISLFIFLERPFPQLAHDQIRILVFRDCDRKGKTLLFDSKAVAQDLNQQVRS